MTELEQLKQELQRLAGMVAIWGNCFARPKSMFQEVVDGKVRFELVGSIDNERDIKIKEWED